MVWFKIKPKNTINNRPSAIFEKRETVVAKLHSVPSPVSELPLIRNRRGQTTGRYIYR